MDAQRFDSLTRVLTASRTRRSALRALAGVALAVAAGPASPAAARCLRKGAVCSTSDECCGSGGCAGNACCPPKQTYATSCPLANQCEPGICCAAPEDVPSFCCPKKKVCGSDCCEEFQRCVGGTCRCTADAACAVNETCVNGRCCTDPDNILSCKSGGGGFMRIRRAQ